MKIFAHMKMFRLTPIIVFLFEFVHKYIYIM